MSDMLLVHHTRNSLFRLPMGALSSECGVGCAPHLTNFVKSGTSRLYSAGALNCMYPGKTSHRPLTSLYQHPYFPIRTWEWDHTNGETLK